MAGRDGGKRLTAPHLLQTTRFSVICFYLQRARSLVRQRRELGQLIYPSWGSRNWFLAY
jgi:hypothetical protein